jgi:hypothetical protein
LGVKLAVRDGSQDIVAFRTDPDAEKVVCGGIESTGQVFAEGKDRSGRTIRRFALPR